MRRAFTLIELLVVIAIIAILAAILFPVFAQAKQSAKKAADLSNVKQLGIGVALYMNDTDDVMPPTYYTVLSSGGSETMVNVHWSNFVLPYIKSEALFVSPGDGSGGMERHGSGDLQAPKLSYIPNAALMAGMNGMTPAMSVNSTAVEQSADTIVLAPMSNVASCMRMNSATRPETFRPANAFTVDGSTPFTGDNPAEFGSSSFYAVSEKVLWDSFENCQSAGLSGMSHMVLTAPYRFGGSTSKWNEGNANYVFLDTHAKSHSLRQTLDYNAFKWGKFAYSAGKQVLNPNTGQPVQ